MLPIIVQDITKIPSGIIMHQVNIEGVMGAGLAKQIAEKWPKVEKEYKDYCNERPYPLGEFLILEAEPDIHIANIFGQSLYVPSHSLIATNYNAVDMALRILKDEKIMGQYPIYVPYLMGCNLGGGDWHIYSYLIEKYFPNAIVCIKP